MRKERRIIFERKEDWEYGEGVKKEIGRKGDQENEEGAKD